MVEQVKTSSRYTTPFLILCESLVNKREQQRDFIFNSESAPTFRSFSSILHHMSINGPCRVQVWHISTFTWVTRMVIVHCDLTVNVSAPWCIMNGEWCHILPWCRKDYVYWAGSANAALLLFASACDFKMWNYWSELKMLLCARKVEENTILLLVIRQGRLMCAQKNRRWSMMRANRFILLWRVKGKS